MPAPKQERIQHALGNETLDVDANQPRTQHLYERWGYVYLRQTISPWGTWLNTMRKQLVIPPGRR